MLNPRNDDKPVIKEFNLQWLSKVRLFNGYIVYPWLKNKQIPARWPAVANIRVRTYMHDHNLYDISEDQDIKILPLVNSIRKGTEIESCEVRQFNLLKTRILERVSSIARDLVTKGLLNTERGTPQKIPEFKNIWQNRHSHWGPKEPVSKSPPKPNSVDIYDMNSLPPESRQAFRTPTAKMLSKAQQPSSSTKVRILIAIGSI
jgi:hypothetical protein